MALDHPSVEIQFPFDDGKYRLRTPPDTTHFYWGAVGLGTMELSPSAITDHSDLRGLNVIEDVRSRISCTLQIDGKSTPLLSDCRRLDTHAECAYWNAVEPRSHPFSVTVSLTLQTPPSTVESHQLALWQNDETRLSWDERYRTEFHFERSATEHQLRLDGLWNRFEAFSPRPIDHDTV